MYRNSLGIDMLHILKSEIIIHMVKGAFFGEGYCCCMEEIIGRWGAARIVGWRATWSRTKCTVTVASSRREMRMR